MNKLTRKQQLFISEYLVDRNATQAAIRAGYGKKNANVVGPRLLDQPQVRMRVDAKLKELGDKVEVNAAELLRELMMIARFDLRKAFANNGSLKSVKDMPEDVARVVSGLDIDELFKGAGRDRAPLGFTKKVRFWDKLRAIEMLLKVEGTLKDRHEVTGKNGAPLAPAQRIDFSGISTKELRKAIGLHEHNGHNGHSGT